MRAVGSGDRPVPRSWCSLFAGMCARCTSARTRTQLPAAVLVAARACLSEGCRRPSADGPTAINVIVLSIIGFNGHATYHSERSRKYHSEMAIFADLRARPPSYALYLDAVHTLKSAHDSTALTPTSRLCHRPWSARWTAALEREACPAHTETSPGAWTSVLERLVDIVFQGKLFVVVAAAVVAVVA